MDVGDSRSVESVFAESVRNRVLSWTADPESVATVDEWGRVTAVGEGEATITAETSDGLKDSVTLTVVKTATKGVTNIEKHDYAFDAVSEVDNLQKLVDRYAKNNANAVPENVKDASLYPNAQTAITADGAVWTITNYGVLRTADNAPTERDKEQRFMGDRYFYSADTGDGKVLAVFSDGEYGIWTVMQEGYTHIKMVKMNGTDKAALMSADTQKNVARRGMVTCSYRFGSNWAPTASDNDGLWTSMYGAGELMRYAVLRDDPNATEEEIAEARKTAYLSTEAVLLLTYISMRTGTVESLVRSQRNGSVSDIATGKWYGKEVLKEGGDYSQFVPKKSPAASFKSMFNRYLLFGLSSYTMKEKNLSLFSADSWLDPTTDSETIPATRTRLLEGFWARTYFFKKENCPTWDYIYWKNNGDGTATGFSTREETAEGYLLNSENLRGVTVDASGEIPARLWNDLIGSGYSVKDIIYKGDTSSDEIIGHLFIYKLAYDILGPEDPEIKELIVRTMDSFAQHIVDNGYSLCESTGQPTTWGKFGRTYLHNGQVLGGAPLQAAVILSAFKLAAYVTGDKKWENEYKMAALDPAYEYAKVSAQEWERYQMSIFEYANSASGVFGYLLRLFANTELFRLVYRLILNYSDEEMAMLAYYLLFQMEDDETLLSYYREGIDEWWYSMSYSENPLWYYIYQLAYPDKELKDVYGNSLVETAAWTLSRHPICTIKYLASNPNRDDIAVLDFSSIGINGTYELSYDPNCGEPWFADSDKQYLQILGVALSGTRLQWKVAAPDERELNRYNDSTYILGTESKAYIMESSQTYTLPYWMGRYHGMLKG